MPWSPTIGQRVDASPNGWTAAAGLRPDPSPYLAAEGFTMEDWNLARHDAVPNPFSPSGTANGDGPVVLGFGQGRVSPARRAKAARLRGGPRFDVCFFTLTGAGCVVHAVYVGALYLDDDDAALVERNEAWRAVRVRREGELRALYPKDADARLRSFRRDRGVRWMVSPNAVVVLDPPVLVHPPKQAERFGNALDWSAHPWWEWLSLGADPTDDDEELPTSVEGRVVVVRHRARERDAAFMAKVKARRLATHGHAKCECCGMVVEHVYGPELRGFIEGHHTRPVASLSDEGEQIRDEDIALLCPTCHRVAHRTGCLTLPDLRALLPKGWSFTAPTRGRSP
jgi:hypothetical protein